MKIRNSTDWPDYFLRRMTSWCAKQIGMPVNTLSLAVFRNSRSAWGGVARQWRKQISVCVGHAGHFPANASSHGEGARFSDRIECLVAVTAHELFHIEAGRPGSENYQSTRGSRGHSSEATTCKEELRVLRDSLLAEWNDCPARIAAPKPSPMEQKRAKAAADLARWQRKLALAKTKVKKLTRRVDRLNQRIVMPD